MPTDLLSRTINFTQDQRQLLIVLVTQEWVRLKADPEFIAESDELEAILRLLHREAGSLI